MTIDRRLTKLEGTKNGNECKHPEPFQRKFILPDTGEGVRTFISCSRCDYYGPDAGFDIDEAEYGFGSWDWIRRSNYLKKEKCEHPPNMVSLFSSGAPPHYLGKPKYIKIHCNGCGWDDYLFDSSRLSPNQRQKWKSFYWLPEGCEYKEWLIENGYLTRILWPPSDEIRAMGKVE